MIKGRGRFTTPVWHFAKIFEGGKIRMKKFLALLLALSMALCLAACGNKQPAASSGAASGSGVPE